jgi:hypothetical protein
MRSPHRPSRLAAGADRNSLPDHEDRHDGWNRSARGTGAAGAVALTEILTKTALYYCHERLWILISWGKRAVRATPK